MPTAPQNTNDHAWEKEFTPKVGRGRLMFSLAVYLLFVGFLAYLAFQRWFTLQ